MPWNGFVEHCLFVFDNWWFSGTDSTDNSKRTGNSNWNAISALEGIASHSNSKIILTTRDMSFNYCPIVHPVLFTGKGKEEAKNILLTCAGLPTAPAESDVVKLLNYCTGLPILLKFIGVNIREQYRGGNAEEFFSHFVNSFSDEDVGFSTDQKLTETTKISISFIQSNLKSFLNEKGLRLPDRPECKRNDFVGRLFSMLSVLKYQQQLPFKVLNQLWNFKEQRNLTRFFVNLFERYSLLSKHQPGGVQNEDSVGMHDRLLDVARELYGEKVAVGKILIQSYMIDVEANFIDQSDLFWKRWVHWFYRHVWSGVFPNWVKKFQDYWMLVEDNRFLSENIISLLIKSKLFMEAQWLILNPAWIVRQLKRGLYIRLLSDIDLFTDCLSEMKQMCDADKEELEVFLRFLKDSLEHVAKTCFQTDPSQRWGNHPYFLLSAKLMYEEKRTLFKRFLQDAQSCIEKPSIWPCLGVEDKPNRAIRNFFRPSGEPLFHCVDENICYVLFRKITGTANNISQLVEDVKLTRYDMETKSAIGAAYVVFSEPVNDRESPNVICAKYAAKSKLIALGLRDARIIILEARFTESADSSSSSSIGNATHWDPIFTDQLRHAVHTISFSKDGKRFAGLSDHRFRLQQLKVWESRTRGVSLETIFEMTIESSIIHVGLNLDGTLLACTFWDNWIRVFRIDAYGELNCIWEGKASGNFSVSMSPNGRFISNRGFGMCELWECDTDNVDANTTSSSKHVLLTYDSPDSYAKCCVHEFSDNAKYFVAGTPSGVIRVWDTENRTLLRKVSVDGVPTRVSITSDGALLSCSSIDKKDFGNVYIFDTNKMELGPKDCDENGATITYVDMDEKRETIVTVTKGKRLCAWDARSSENILTIQIEVLGSVTALRISSDGKWIATGDSTGTVRLLEVRKGRKSFSAILPLDERKMISSLSMSKNCRHVVCGAVSKVAVWKLTPFWGFIHHRKEELSVPSINNVDISLDGTRVTCVIDDG